MHIEISLISFILDKFFHIHPIQFTSQYHNIKQGCLA